MLVIGQHSPSLKDSPTQSVGQAPKVCTSGGGIVAAKFEMPSRFFTGGRPPSFLSGEFPLICNSDFIVFPLLGRSVVLRLFARSFVGFGSTAPSSFLPVCLLRSAPLSSSLSPPFIRSSLSIFEPFDHSLPSPSSPLSLSLPLRQTRRWHEA